MSVIDESGREFKVDLTNCDREPIHIPGHVQGHGALLAVHPDYFTILQASQNVATYFGTPAETLLGKELSILLDPTQMGALRDARQSQPLAQNPVYVFQGEIGGQGPFDVSAHTYQGILIIEAEAVDQIDPAAPDFQALVTESLVRLQSTKTLEDFCQAAAVEFRKISGFDRVMIYRFLQDASGTVVAEDLAPGIESFLGLHYPASDIPKQARALFVQNASRIIPDPSYEPSPIVPTLNPLTDRPLDMSYASLRGVSPMHTQYLRNMGVCASMSQAIVVDGQLWGLIASHHYENRRVPYGLRRGCEFLAKLVALMVRGKVDEEQSSYRQQIEETHDALVESMSRHRSIVEGLTGGERRIEHFVDCTGCAILADGECHLIGQTPTPTQVRVLAEWLRRERGDELYVTDSLSREYPEGERMKDVASGVLSIRLTKVPGEFVLWFRPEVVKTVNWAGNPTKPVEPTPSGDRLNPRKSFELWQEEVRDRSNPWKRLEIESARRLRIAITEMVIRRAEEVSRANVRLERSNVELDSFAYIASHDLKEPLRGIHNYSTFLLEDYGEALDETGRERLRTLVRLAERMETLTDSLLHFSRLGRQELDLQKHDLNDVLQEAIEATSARLEETGTEVRIPWPLPTVTCDGVQLVEVFQNLIANAAKYNDKPHKWIEVGVRSEGALPGEQPHVLYVRDNGIGIPRKHFESIFRIFKRLHGRTEFGGGTGAGLTITEKVVQRHGGRLWLESEPGQGTTFFFTLGA